MDDQSGHSELIETATDEQPLDRSDGSWLWHRRRRLCCDLVCVPPTVRGEPAKNTGSTASNTLSEAANSKRVQHRAVGPSGGVMKVDLLGKES